MSRSNDDLVNGLLAALEHSPDNLPLIRQLAVTLMDLERYAEAETWLRKGLAIDGQSDALRIVLARCYVKQNKVSHAQVLIDLMVERTPPVAEAWMLRGQIELAARSLNTAREAFQKAIDLDPSLADTPEAQRLGLQPKAAADAEPPAWNADADDDVDVDEDLRALARHDQGEGDPFDDSDLERPKINFSDVGGMESVKEEISIKVIQPLAHPELFAAYGKKVGGGILLYGPPGCGKTHLARATAGEAKAKFFSVGIHDVLDMYIGQSEQKLHALFARARKNHPCVLFFDEVDALAAKRSDLAKSAGRQVINQFLSEMDGIDEANDGLLVLAATNSPWHMDAAFRRPGRFDRVVFVPPPDEPARAAILEVMLQDKPTDNVDLAKLAKKCDGFSGADLKGAVDQCIEGKLREALKKGAPTPITTSDMMGAIKQMKPSTKEWFATARNHVLFANEGGLYDDVAKYMGI
tara:strand:- start:6746 stop:8143 length:1398 start_codon:yes stop_codon:yes gene_type:complete